MPDKTMKDDEAIEAYSKTDESLPPVLVLPGYGAPQPKEPLSLKKLMWRLVFALALMIAILSVVAVLVATVWNNSTSITGLPDIDFTFAFGAAAVWRVMALVWRM